MAIMIQCSVNLEHYERRIIPKMLKHLFAVYVLILLPMLALQDDAIKYLEPGVKHVQEAHGLLQRYTNKRAVRVFCQDAEPIPLWETFKSQRLHLEIGAVAEQYKQYKEETAGKIMEAHDVGREWAEGKASASKDKYIKWDGNKPGCYGLFTDHAFSLTLETKSFDKWLVTKMWLGFLLWLAAPHLVASRRGLSCLAPVLSFHLVTWLMAYANGHKRLVREGSLWAAWLEVLNERPIKLALAFAGCWYAVAFLLRRLRSRIVRRVILCLAKGFALWLIFSASDRKDIGLLCGGFLFFYPIVSAIYPKRPGFWYSPASTFGEGVQGNPIDLGGAGAATWMDLHASGDASDAASEVASEAQEGPPNRSTTEST